MNEFIVNIGEIETISYCNFPENYSYNESILINCTISDLKGIDPSKNGLYIKASTNLLMINNVEYNSINFLNANTLMPGYNIIFETNKTQYICYSSSPPTVLTTTF